MTSVAVGEPEIGCGQQRKVRNIALAQHRSARAASISNDDDSDHNRAELTDHVDGLDQRRAAGGRVLGDDDSITRLKRASDSARDAMILCLFANAETAQHSPPCCRYGRNSECHRIGAHRQPTDSRRVVGDHCQRRVGNKNDSIRSARSLFGVKEVAALSARLQREFANSQRVFEDMTPQRLAFWGHTSKLLPLAPARSL
jgi:hypothetical protein